MLIHLLCSWTLLISRFYLKHNVSETGFCLRLQVEPTQLGPIDRPSSTRNGPEIKPVLRRQV
jgi:hypothetical protein